MIRQAVVLAAADDVARARVAGLTLVERTLRTLARAGVEQIVVAGRESLRALVEDSAAPASIAFVVCEEPEAAAAVRAAVPHLVEGVGLIVVPQDRIIDPALIKQLAGADLGAADVWTAGEIGLIAGSANLVTELAAGTLTEAIARLAERDRRGTLELGPQPWHRAGTAEERKRAADAMFRSLFKRTDGPVSRRLNRHISVWVTRRIVGTGITPNQMTYIANIIGALGVVLVFQATWTMVAIGALLVQMQSILDGCDGEIARLTFQSSKFGEWLDNVLDDQVNIGYGIALGYAATVMTNQWWWQWIGIGSGIAFFFHNAVFYYQLAFVHRSGNPFNFRWWFEKPGVDVQAMLEKDGSFLTKVGAFFRSLIRRDVFLFGFLLWAAAGLPAVASAWYGAVAASQGALMLVHVVMGGARQRRAS